ncbi:2Fe-2S iron-sulfur cluster-binding protein [Rahnella woolbedingensis]|uniref:Ferredoxin n=3 Tax=Rahnella TaxID=34037 RepID=A0A419N995_9GAMM|nr:2Fe-2S iron-sulfur cluster-binding protein [Rahnella woolbedingensis]MBU9844036.1 2Fe-2S iron-sulfur cluster binding domain-containing protein [Rahnella ecdela]RJT44356.1 ferredoxin [Rahnella woolbedingensis]
MPSVTFTKSETEFTFRDVISLLECRDNMKFGCKTGNCGLCRVKVLSGIENITSITTKERRLFKVLEIEDPDIRLACQCKITGDVTLIENFLE